MTRAQLIAVLTLVAAIPAAAAAAHSFFSARETPCFAAGSIGYRLSDKAGADFTIKIDNTAAAPDLALQLVSDPNIADFVLADGGDNMSGCAGIAIRTIRLDPQAAEPDLVIALAPQARYKIYAHSADFSAHDAAALFAVMWKSGRKFLAAR